MEYHGKEWPPNLQIAEKLTPRKFSAIVHDHGVALCTNTEGAFLCIRFVEELESLKKLLAQFDGARLAKDL